MFGGALVHEQSALIFPASSSDGLASTIRRLASDADLYARLSTNSEQAWQALQLPVQWGELLDKWLADRPADLDWLWQHRLNSGLYDRQIEARRKS
jgi:hypothetical protein